MTMNKIDPSCWLDKDTGFDIPLYLKKAMVVINQDKLVCWAYGYYQKTKTPVSSWHTRNFKDHIFHMQPITINGLNRILAIINQTVNIKFLMNLGNGAKIPVKYPIRFRGAIVKSKRFGHIFTLDDLKIAKIKHDYSQWQSVLPHPNSPKPNSPKHDGPEL